ncbi:MAG: hypothetical protein AAGD07_15685 [Planctomycetota bacterium]
MPEIDDAFAWPKCLTTQARELIEQAKLPGLSGGPHDASLASVISTSFDSLILDSITGDTRDYFRSALWLLAGDLDRSHTISQDLPSQEGSFWHGIMHRRENDFSNAKYWFRRVGNHPAFAQIARFHADVYNDPTDFVDHVERAIRGGGDDTVLREAQWTEWQCLMDNCLDF